MQPTSEATPISKEAVLRSFSALSSNDRKWVIRHQKLEEETTALRARLPNFLQPFASNISLYDPSKEETVERRDGPHESGFNLSESLVALTISPPPSPLGSKSPIKYLDIQSDHWWTCHRYLSGESRGEKNAIFLDYGAADAWNDGDAKLNSGYAYAATFSDPGQSLYAHTSKRVQEVIADVVADMGYTADLDEDACMEVLDAFIGTPGARLLSHEVREEPSLQRIIREGLEMLLGRLDDITGDYWGGLI